MLANTTTPSPVTTATGIAQCTLLPRISLMSSYASPDTVSALRLCQSQARIGHAADGLRKFFFLSFLCFTTTITCLFRSGAFFATSFIRAMVCPCSCAAMGVQRYLEITLTIESETQVCRTSLPPSQGIATRAIFAAVLLLEAADGRSRICLGV
jgi:hypothetical protein